MNPSSNAQPKISEMYPGIYQPASQAEGQDGLDLPMQPLNTLLGFDLETYQVPLDHLLPSKKIMDGTMSTRKYKQVVSSNFHCAASNCRRASKTLRSANGCWR